MNTKKWRHMVIKHYRNRAKQFVDKAKTPEEKSAWEEVVYWFDSILTHGHRDSKGNLVLREDAFTNPKHEELITISEEAKP